MAISVVQRGNNTDIGAAGTISQAFASANTVGNKIIVIGVSASNTPTNMGVSDSLGNTYLAVTTGGNVSNYLSYRVWIVDSAVAGTATVTVTESGFYHVGLFIWPSIY
jgi:hypothetical protein